MGRLGRVGFLVAGLGLVGWILWAVGWPAVQANVATIGASFVLLVGLYAFAQLAFMAGWWMAFDPSVASSRFLSLFGAYLAGDSVNYLVPSGNLAGEPVKAHLVRETFGLGAAVTSVTVYKHAELVAQWLFLAAGVGVSLWHFDLPTPVVLAAAAILGFLGGSLLVVTWALRKGTLVPLLDRLARWGPLAARLGHYQPTAGVLDAGIQTFYRTRGRWFVAATGWCLVGWCGGLVESYLLLRLLAPQAGWATAVAVEALAMTLNSVIAFIPGRAGSAEGVRVGVFLLLGLPAAQGAAYGLARRGRELVWVLPGLVVLLARQGGRLRWPGLAPSGGKNTPA